MAWVSLAVQRLQIESFDNFLAYVLALYRVSKLFGQKLPGALWGPPVVQCCYGLGAISYALLGLGLSKPLNRTNPLNKVRSQKGSDEHKLRYADLHGEPPTAHCVLSPRADNLHGAALNCHLDQGLSPMDYFKFPKALKTFKNLSMQNWGGPREFLCVAKLHGHKPKQELSSHSLNSYTRGAAEPVLATGRRSPTRGDWLSLFKTAVLQVARGFRN